MNIVCQSVSLSVLGLIATFVVWIGVLSSAVDGIIISLVT